ncbi:carboxylesterase/lipase family protein [Streptomyces sp. NPDC017890]|uniref:carboxylesterase/lipase family protein n=1 Tax=Streptomyces sp. NPDC017890 TaxID=3365015 RepID=UPI003796D3CE
MLKKTAHAAVALALTAGTVAAAGTATAAAGRDATAAAGRDGGVVVRTDKGSLRGTAAGAVSTFQGIPYAAPPTGERRWAPPAPARRWHGVRDATEPGAACPQTGAVPPAGPASSTEDCLFLDVTVPRAASDRPRAVMVYLHGGDHTDGSGAMHGARRLAAQGDVIVVTVNYRLGALGYLAHPDLERRAESGNYGFLDQQAALRWVERNAAAFGGDPHHVTLFGESAGATSTCAHLVAPSSAGLFDRVVLQSGACLRPDAARERADALSDGEDAAEAIGERATGSGGTADWRTADPRHMVYVFGRGPFAYGPVYGGKLLPRSPQEAFATGRYNKVPVLQGINREEDRAMVYGAELAKRHATQDPQATLDEADYRARLEEDFGPEKAAAVAARYPVSAYGGSAALALSAVLTDAGQARHTVDTGRALARGGARTYTYEFADRETPWYADAETYAKPSFPMGAAHTFELPYLFELTEFEPLTEPQRALSDAMIRIWSDFARSGEAPWKATTPAALNAQSLASGPGGIRPVDFAKDHQYDFWKSLG